MSGGGWNYRVLRRTGKVGDQHWTTYAVHEVYYDEDGTATSCTEDAVAPRGDTPEEVKRDHALQAQAFNRPVLDYDSFDPFRKEAPQ